MLPDPQNRGTVLVETHLAIMSFFVVLAWRSQTVKDKTPFSILLTKSIIFIF